MASPKMAPTVTGRARSPWGLPMTVRPFGHFKVQATERYVYFVSDWLNESIACGAESIVQDILAGAMREPSFTGRASQLSLPAYLSV